MLILTFDLMWQAALQGRYVSKADPSLSKPLHNYGRSAGWRGSAQQGGGSSWSSQPWSSPEGWQSSSSSSGWRTEPQANDAWSDYRWKTDQPQVSGDTLMDMPLQHSGLNTPPSGLHAPSKSPQAQPSTPTWPSAPPGTIAQPRPSTPPSAFRKLEDLPQPTTPPVLFGPRPPSLAPPPM